MKQTRANAKSLLPYRVRSFFRTAHQEVVFRRAMKRFMLAPARCAQPRDPVLTDLIYGWGNDAWSAQDEYLAACVELALATPGPILECGSGLSTILVGAIAHIRGLRYWTLEHLPEWAARVRQQLRRYQIDWVQMSVKPLKDYGEFCWYNPPLDEMPDEFAFVLCDGPPGTGKGGRYGLVPIMREQLKPGCVIMLDDAGREQERAIAQRWQAELGASCETLGSTKPFIKLTT